LGDKPIFYVEHHLEDEIPEAGLNVDYVGDCDSNNAGFGERYKQGMRPEDIPLVID